VTYARRVPRSLASPKKLEQARDHFKPPVAYVTVQARGWQTARVLAAERIAEATSILDLMERPKLDRLVGEATLLREKGGRSSFAFDRTPRMIHPAYVDPKGRLLPPFLQLSRAVAKDEDTRSDWERRVLAAARWFSRGLNSTAASDRLVAMMIALETLFIAGRHERRKGVLLAQRISDRGGVNELTADEQRVWLAGLYDGRNASTHEGRDFAYDLDVDRLTELTYSIVRAMSVHLIPAHRPSGRSCRTFDDAMACSLT
jgi:hypothetical protein